METNTSQTTTHLKTGEKNGNKLFRGDQFLGTTLLIGGKIKTGSTNKGTSQQEL